MSEHDVPPPLSSAAQALLSSEASRPGPSPSQRAALAAALSAVGNTVSPFSTIGVVASLCAAAGLGLAGGAVMGMQHAQSRIDAAEHRAAIAEQRLREPMLPPPELKCPEQTCQPGVIVREREVFTGSSLEAERQLVARIQTALVRGNVKAAENAVAEYRHRFPQGRLREELDALEIRVLVAQQHHALARVKADAFARKYPESVFRFQLKQLLDDEGSP